MIADDVDPVEHRVLAVQGQEELRGPLQRPGGLGGPARLDADPTHLVEAAGEPPAGLGVGEITPHEPFVKLHGPLDQSLGRLEIARGGPGQAHVAPGPGQVAAEVGVAGIAGDELLVDRDGAAMEADRVGGMVQLQVDHAEVRVSPGEDLPVASRRGMIAGECLLDGAGLLVGPEGFGRAAHGPEGETHSRVGPAQGGLHAGVVGRGGGHELDQREGPAGRPPGPPREGRVPR